MCEKAGILENFRLFGCVGLGLGSGSEPDHATSVSA